MRPATERERRLLWAYVALIVAIAMLGTGMFAYAERGGNGKGKGRHASSAPPVVVQPDEPVEEPPTPGEPATREEPPPPDGSATPEPPPPADEPSDSVQPDPGETPVLTPPEGTPAAPGGTPEPPSAPSEEMADATVVPPTDLGIYPTVVPGNPRCEEHSLFKLEDVPRSGTYTVDSESHALPAGSSITIVRGDDYHFDFSATGIVVHTVIVKASNAAHIYSYGQAGVSADGNLWAVPKDEGNGEGYHAISWIGFCWSERPQEPRGSVLVRKFEDSGQAVGVWEPGEAMLEGWEFVLTDAAGTEVGRGFTDADGELAFSDLPIGSYAVTEVLQAGWSSTTGVTKEVSVGIGDPATVWFGNARDVYRKTFELTYPDKPENVTLKVTFLLNGEPVALDLTGEGPVYTAVVDVPYPYELTEIRWWSDGPYGLLLLGTGEDETLEGDAVNTFTYTQPATGAIHVYKYDDENANGTHDAGEAMLAGWEFHIDHLVPFEGEAEHGGVGLTDDNGEVVFDDLGEGTYRVTETLQEGWVSTTGVVAEAIVKAGEQTALWFGNKRVPPEVLDLAITKSADRDEAEPGELVTYTLTYWNIGGKPATDFTITDDFDERYMSVVDAAGGVVWGGTITWTLAGPLSATDGPQTIVYTVRVSSEMPDGITNVDNVVVISHPEDADPTNNTDDERVVVEQPYEPYTPEPYLPFTGGEYLLLLSAALAAAVIGLLLRLRSDRAA